MGAVGVWLGKTLVGRLITSYAVNALTNKLFGTKTKNDSPTYGIGALQTQTNSESVMPIIYGRVKCAGNNLWQSDPATTVQRLVGFGLGKNKGVSDVRLDDIPIYAITALTITYTGAEAYGRCRYTNKTLSLTTPSGINSLDCSSKTIQDLVTWINSFPGWYAVFKTSMDISEIKDINGKHQIGISMWYGVDCTNTTVSITSDSLANCSYTAYMGDGEQLIDIRVAGDTQEAKAKLVGGMKYDAYLALTITGSDKISSNPNVTAVWEGRIVKIYSTSATGGFTLDLKTGYFVKEDWSDNVWCVLDFMTSQDGCNIPVADIDIQSFITAAAYAQPGDGSRNWSINLILDQTKKRQDWLNEMLLCFRAWRTYQNGKHGILIDKPEPVSQIFIVKKTESIQIDWQELSEDVERIILKYRDPDYEWQQVGAPATIAAPFRNATYNADGNIISNGTPLSKTVEVNGITNFEQASQHSWFHLNQAKTCDEYITYTCNKRALNRTIGDVVGIFDPITQRTEPGLEYKRYRIMAMTEPQGMQIQLYCREYNEAIYTDQLGSVRPVISATKLKKITPVTLVDPPISVEYFSTSILNGDVLLTWKPIADPAVVVNGYEIRKNSDWASGQLVTKVSGKDSDSVTVPAFLGNTVYWIAPYNAGGYATAISDYITIDTLPGKDIVQHIVGYDSTATISGGGARINDFIIQYSSVKYLDIKSKTYAELKETRLIGSGESAVTVEGPVIDIGKLARLLIVPQEVWKIAPNSPVVYEIMTASDDEGLNWLYWKLLPTGVINTRYFKLRFTINSSTRAAVLEQLNVLITAHLQTLNFINLNIPIGGLTITYNPEFLNKPGVFVSPNGGAILLPKKTNESNIGCTIQLCDTNGADVGGTADVTVPGF